MTGGAGYLPRTWASLEIERLLAEDAAKNKGQVVAQGETVSLVGSTGKVRVYNAAANSLVDTVDLGVDTNTGVHAVDVSGWLLRDAANNVLVVGEGYELAPGEQLRVYTGPGTDAER